MAAPEVKDSRLASLPLLHLPILSFCIILPLALHGPSCGHDFGFHMQSWMDAAQQIRHGDPLPRWACSPAFNAGEPRFIFYPPLSWLLGSVLMIVLPPAAVPAAFTWLALTAAAFAMYRLASQYTSRAGALLAAAVYIANPYMLFTAFERTAFAELLAAAWLPLLFRAVLAEQPSALAIGIPLALLWLTNAPAAVMGTYALVLLVLSRAVLVWLRSHRAERLQTLLGPAAGGLVLGLALAGFYLVPAALQRRYVQIAMAIIPNMRVEDNFLFGHTGYGPHDAVLHTASMVSLDVAGLTAIALLLAYLRERRLSDRAQLTAAALTPDRTRQTSVPLLVLAAGIMLLLWHFTLPLWHLLPEMVFLQFPWRLLALLGCVLGLATALAFRQLRIPLVLAALAGFLWVGAATALATPVFREVCEAGELPAQRLARFDTHHGVGPTDEYTPTDADNDQLRWDDPAWWLASTPNAPGPNTVPNPAATILDYDQPPPMEQTISGLAPRHLQLHLQRPEDLILNLRDYPTWLVSVNGNAHPTYLERDDGLIAVALPAGDDVVDVRWHTLPDMWAGDGLSVLALAIAGWLRSRSRRIEA